MISKLISLFNKKEPFHESFERIVDNIFIMSNSFNELLKEKDIVRKKEIKEYLQTLEHLNDEITHKAYVKLSKMYITPYDREDIHLLISKLDDVSDYIWHCAKQIFNYEIKTDDILLEFSDVIVKSIISLKQGVYSLRKMDKDIVIKISKEIDEYENMADDTLQKGFNLLFSGKVDIIELIKKKDIYKELEKVTDVCDDVTDIIETIIIKYG